ncbi:MAG TPA: hypothetical protein VEC37_09930, partial [Bacillota bacterium]|nr:hypothetical protein [Bacillota bacterium]
MTPASLEIQTLLQLIRGKILQLPVRKPLKDLFLENLVRAVDCLAREDFTGLNSILGLLSNQITAKIKNTESSPNIIEALLKEIYVLQQILVEITANATLPPLSTPSPTDVLPANNPEYGYFYNLGSSQHIAEGQSVTFSTHGPLSKNVHHTPGQAEIAIGLPGVYQISYFLNPVETNSVFELCLNQSPLPGSRLQQAGPAPLQGHGLTALGIAGSLT